MRYPVLFLASTVLSLSLAQTAPAQAPPQDPKMVDTGMKDATTMDREFLMNAAMGNLMEVEMGKVAVEKTANGELKAFGEMMTSDHGGANAELKALAAKKGVEVPTALDDSGEKAVEESRKASGPTFDRRYVTQMVNAHRQAVLDFEKAAKETQDTDIRAFAMKTLPTLKAHLVRIEEIQRSMS